MTQGLQQESSDGGSGSLGDENSQEVRDAIAANLGLPQGFPMGGFSIDAIKPIMRAFMGSLIAAQLGQSVGGLAIRITGSHDVSLPLFSQVGTHLIPQNVKLWSEGLDIPEAESRYFLALREAAAARLFAHTPWLGEYIRQCMTEYGKGIRIDVDAIQRQAEDAMASGELDISNPESISIAINQGMFMPEQSAQQAQALEKLEMALALIEGWVDHVVALAAKDRLPSLGALQEMQRRNRATNSPSQQLFASLLGLEVSPRKARECALFWGELYGLGAAQDIDGAEIRDHRWEDSALLPTARDLADPEGFIKSTTVPDDLSGLI
jgi:putative hydrolase